MDEYLFQPEFSQGNCGLRVTARSRPSVFLFGYVSG